MSKRVRTFRIDPEDEALVEAAARRTDLPTSAFIRRAVVSRAAEIISSSCTAPGATGDSSREGGREKAAGAR